MFAKFSQIFSPKHKKLRKKIMFTLMVLFIFKFGTAIIVPGAEQIKLETSNLGFLELINIMGGGALSQFSIFALGVIPYITASIIIQLAQADIIPYLSELAKEGHTGRMKINQITRVLGILMAFVQGYMMSFIFVDGGTPMQYMQFAVVLTAGTALLLWMGDQITSRGIGNGISILIMAGIIASLPGMIYQVWHTLIGNGLSTGVLLFMAFIILYLLIIIGVIFIETATRRIPIQYTNKSTSISGDQSYLPFKLNSAGVLPVIFGSSLLYIPLILAYLIESPKFKTFVDSYLAMETPTGFILYALMVIGFAYFYAHFQVKPTETAERLQKNGGFIPGIRPGEETVSYIVTVLNRITFVGALFLAFVAILPIIFTMVTKLPSSVSVGGTGLLIVVGVALDTYKRVNNELISHDYRKRRGRKA